MKNLFLKEFWMGVWFYACFLKSCIPIRKQLRIIKKKNLPEKLEIETIQKLFRGWMNNFWLEMGIKVHHIGLEKIPTDNKCVIISNHLSFLDIPSLTPFVPANKSIAKIEPSRYPIFGTIWTSLSVLVNLKDKESRNTAFKKMYSLLDDGIIPLFYPEEARNTTDEPLLPFQPGAFVVSNRRKVPIVPIVIIGANHILKPGCSFTPGRILVEVLEPMEKKEDEDLERFIHRVRTTMLEVIKKHGN